MYNAMFLVCVSVKHFVQHMDKLRIHEHFEMDRITGDGIISNSVSNNNNQDSTNNSLNEFAGDLEIDPQVADGMLMFPNH